MKRTSALLLASALVAAMTTFTTTSPAAADGPSCGDPILKSDGTPWTCTFADEFSGTTLDRTKWTAQETAIGGLSGGGVDCWVDNPNTIQVNAGTLKLTSRQYPWPILCRSPHGNYVTPYISGSVSTRGTFEQTYGRWEIRAKFGSSQVATGTQSALWLYPAKHTYGEWPASGEIDIAEYYSKYPDRAIPVIHYNRADTEDKSHTDYRCLIWQPWQFHTYTLVWTSTDITISIDGQECVDHTISAAPPLTGSAPFDQPFVTYLTQTLGMGQNPFDPATTPLPQQTQVDYVRVWS